MRRKYHIVIIGIVCLALNTLASARPIRIKLRGQLPHPIKKNITSILLTLEKHANMETTPGAGRLRRQITNRVIEATSPFGYFSPQIHLQQQQNIFIAHVNLGKPIIVTSIHVVLKGAGHHDKHFQRYLRRIPIKIGSRFQSQRYSNIKNNLFRIASNRGYFKATLTKGNVIIDRKKKSAQITLIFHTGNRFRIGDSHISRTPLNPFFIRKYITYKQGEFYSNAKIQKTQRALSNSDYFQQAIVTPELNKIHHNTVPIDIRLTPVIKKEYNFGLGYGTNTSFRSLISITNNYINPDGHKLSMIAQLSKLNQNVSSTYTIPGYRPRQNYYSLTGAYTQFKVSKTKRNSKAVKISVGSTHLFQHWTRVFSINALNEQYSLVTSTVAKMLYPQLHVEYKKLDKPLQTRNGIAIDFNATGTIKALSSKSAFSQISIGIKTLNTVAKTHTRVLLRGNIAKTYIHSINNLPLSMQLFAGGTQSIRGYEYEALGPGKNLFTASAEIQQKIVKQLYFATFYDTGNVTNTKKLFKHTSSAAGVGLAWLSPIGMLEITAAHPIKKKNSKWVFQFSMGAYL